MRAATEITPSTGSRFVRARNRIAWAFVALSLAGLSAAAPAPPRGHGLPPGAGRTLVERHCLICHSTMLITQQHKDSTAWEKTLTQMKTWGAPLVAGERDTLRAYLLEHFGPRP